MNNDSLRGKRYISLVRCSTTEQIDNSLNDQLLLLNAFAEKHGMVRVDEIRVGGVSGSLPARRKELAPLLDRAERGEYEVILVHDLSRLTRSGVKLAYKLECEFEQRGVKVVSATEDIPDGPAGEMYRTFKYQASQAYVRNLAHDSTRTTSQMILNGRLPHCQKPPFGVDRLYIGLDGKPKYRIRNLTTGYQQRLEANIEHVIEEYPPNHGGRRHHMKQHDDRVELVPGDPKQAEIVRHIFKRYFINGFGCRRIASELTTMGVATQNGHSYWCEATINSIITNPTYCGIGIANRRSKAVYYMRSDTAPKPASVDLQTLMKRESPPTVNRPRDEWVLVRHPHLEDYLESGIREMAKAHQFEVLERKSLKIRAPQQRDKHVESKFILKGILRSVQNNEPMSGQISRPRKKTYRYYVVGKNDHLKYSRQGLNGHIPAEPIEAAVLSVVRDVLSDLPELRQRIVQLALRRITQEAEGRADLDAMQKELSSIDNKLVFLVDEIGISNAEALRAKVQQLKSRRSEIVRTIQTASATPVRRNDNEDAEAVADAVMTQIRTLRTGLAHGCNESIRKLIRLLFAKLAVDLKTKKVCMELRVPSWVAHAGVRLNHELAFETTPEANTEKVPVLAVYECDYKLKYENRCFKCSRRAA